MSYNDNTMSDSRRQYLRLINCLGNPTWKRSTLSASLHLLAQKGRRILLFLLSLDNNLSHNWLSDKEEDKHLSLIKYCYHSRVLCLQKHQFVNFCMGLYICTAEKAQVVSLCARSMYINMSYLCAWIYRGKSNSTIEHVYFWMIITFSVFFCIDLKANFDNDDTQLITCYKCHLLSCLCWLKSYTFLNKYWQKCHEQSTFFLLWSEKVHFQQL